jgi:eukaryotic-like serine/threonine-protein kinase
MSMHVTVALDAEGPIAVKTATGAADVARLRLEAERLERAAHPGLVLVVGSAPGTGVDTAQDNDEQSAELRTRFAGDPISRWTGSVASVAGLGAAVAATLADLHDIGVVHGRIDPSHVLIGDDGRPRLCGLSHPGGAEPHDDVAALARVLGDVLGRAAEQRSRPWAARSRTAHRRALEQVLARALDPVPSRRPNARLLARSILTAVPVADLPASGPPAPGRGPAYVPPDEELLDLVFTHELTDDERWAQAFGDDPPPAAGDADPGPSRTPHHRSGTRVAMGSGAIAVAAVAATAAIAAIAASVLFTAGWRSPGSAAPPDTVQPTTPASRGEECPAAPAPAADVDGDGCTEALAVGDGTISAGPVRWTLGQPGDLIAIGDWACDGRPAPALLRPATGDVFVFPGWAPEGEPVTVEARDRLPGAVAIRGEPVDGGCDELVVDLRSGATATVEVR